ncbi:MAG: glycosyltransferase [Patescibacteria group bacterium]|nr:glycosyltransferase [Patescibacteria group bacterium]
MENKDKRGKMKIAFVYDRVNKWGGAERVMQSLHEIWPEAPLYTSVYCSQTASWAKDFKIIPSFLQKFPWAKKNHEFYAPLMPLAFEGFDFDEYDVVISVSSEAAKGIITKPKTLHLCYCLTPTRYLWSGYEEYFGSKLVRLLLKPLTGYLRKWDLVAAKRVDRYLAISLAVQERIKRYYGKASEVLYPPVDLDKFKVQNEKFKIKVQNSNFFLVVSRLVSYKKVDLVIEVFNKLGWNLKIVGVGREMQSLRKKAKNNIEFLGLLTDKELLAYYQNCEALIFPQEEDFGLVPLEAQACGKPVIAFAGGGALETIIEGKTGIFFREQKVEDLVRALRGFEGGGEERIRPEDCRRQAEKFSQEKFIINFKKIVDKEWQDHLKTISTF